MHGYFVAELRCPQCNSLSPADPSTEMQQDLEIQDNRASMYLKQNAPFEMVRPGPTRAGFLARQSPEPDGDARLLQYWICPECDTEPSWAEILMAPTPDATAEHRFMTIKHIRAVARNREALAAVDYVGEEILEDLERRIGCALRNGDRLVDDHLERLDAVLPLV